MNDRELRWSQLFYYLFLAWLKRSSGDDEVNAETSGGVPEGSAGLTAVLQPTLKLKGFLNILSIVLTIMKH